MTGNHSNFARDAFLAGGQAADPSKAVEDYILETEPHKHPGPLHIIAVGKAAMPMARGAVDSLRFCGSDDPIGYVVSDVKASPCQGYPKSLSYLQGEYPLLTKRSGLLADQILEFAKGLSEDDVCLVLISSGASAMVNSPMVGCTIEDMAKVDELLLDSAASVHESATVQKHISNFCGGWLAVHLYPAKSHVIILSDVVGSDPSTIAGGPMSPDTTTFQDAWKVINKYGLVRNMPERIYNYLKSNIKSCVFNCYETPQSGSSFFDVTETHIIGSNDQSIKADNRP